MNIQEQINKFKSYDKQKQKWILLIIGIGLIVIGYVGIYLVWLGIILIVVLAVKHYSENKIIKSESSSDEKREKRMSLRNQTLKLK